MKKKFICIVLLVFMFVPLTSVKAKTLQDLYNELNSLQSKYNTAKNNKALTQAEITKINNELAEIKSQIIQTQNNIATTQEEIVQSERDIENKKEETNEFLKFLQITTGENAYLEYLFDAEDYTDFIYRYAIVTQMSEYNNNLISELETLINELEEKKVTLKQQQSTLENQQSSYNSKLITLKANLSSYEEEGASLEDEISGLKKQISHYEDLGCKLDQDINSCTAVTYSTGWRYPLAYGCVTWEYNYDAGHYGIDLSCIPEGSPVYPAAAGIVINVIYHYWCGGNMVYIYHVVNGVEYTTAYMHLLSYNVKIGDKVTTDTVIGYMGGGASTQVYDDCTTGAHLHFGVASGNRASGFNAYSFNARNILSFPTGWGYFYRK